ncbi:MAG: hypothetical protein U1D69_09945, partial [Polynucleobacter sp.]|nr:hypothetical protein [Polynucleobacter sp.]
MSRGNVLLLGFTVPDAVWQRLLVIDPCPAVQTHKFAWSLARALRSAFKSVTLLSAYPVQNYPAASQFLFRRAAFCEQGVDGFCMGFLNVLGLKHFTRFVSCLLLMPSIVRRRRIDWVIVHGVHSPFLAAGILSRLLGARFAVVLTDLPSLVLPLDGLLTRQLKRIDRALVGLLLRQADAVFCLAPGMVSHFGIRRPALVLPGILSSEFVALVERE